MAEEPGRIPEQPRVVIVGAGFGGLNCAQALGGKPVHVTLVDRQNYHLFAPLLYQVATAELSPAEIAEPIRKILARHRNIEVLLGEVTGVDVARRQVRLADGQQLPYDRLVLATGATHSYFGHPDWARYAPGLKTIDDARDIRTRILLAFEEAETCTDPDRQKALMTTVIVGGGPTGVELAGAIAELARFTLARDFRRIDPRSSTILLVESGPRVLASFPEDLSRYAVARLERHGVRILSGRTVEQVSADGVVVAGRFIPAGTVIWAAGVQPSPAARWLGAAADRAGRLIVNPDLSVPGFDGVYALGDTATLRDDQGHPLPGLAQVAKQQGRHLGRALADEILLHAPVPPFRFRNRGTAAIIGRNAAVFDFGRRRLRGLPAWVLWAIVHIFLLVGFENRMLVAVQWFWRYLTYESGARLITGGSPRRQAEADGNARRQLR